MRVTVAVCTWNRCELLRHALEQCTRIAVPPGMSWELLVVNNNSSDGTDRVIEEWSQRLPLRRVFEERPGLSHARNAALASATGEYVLFTDDDVLVDETWLVAFDAATRQYPEAVAVGGVITPWFLVNPDPALLEVFAQLRMGFCGLDHGREAGPLPPDLHLFGANMAFRLAAVRGLRFDPTLGARPGTVMGGEEVEFVRQLRSAGGMVLWWPAMQVRHYVEPSRMTLDYLLRHEAGIGAAQVLMAQPMPAGSFLGAPRWLWRRRVEVGVRCWLSLFTRRDTGPRVGLLSGPPPSVSASRRVRVLTWRRELARLRGMARGYRQRSG